MSASFDSYKIFYYVAKYGNITHAASALFLSQSTVSRSIQNLEAELGCRLFDRFQHGVILTREGELLYKHISNACEQIFLGEERLRKSQQTGGRISLGINDYTLYQAIIPVIKDFRKDFPAYEIEISSHPFESHDSLFSSLSNGQLDFACTMFPVPVNNDFTITSIAEQRDVLIASNEHHELKGKIFSLSELRSYPFASLNSGVGASYIEQAFSSHGIIMSPEFKVDSFSHFIPLVVQGLCLAIVPRVILMNYKDRDQVFTVRVREALPVRTLYAITAKNRPHSAARDELIKRIRKHFQQHIRP